MKALHSSILPACCFLAAAASLGAQTLLNDDFSDGDRTNQALPNSGAWYFGSGVATGSSTVTDGVLQLDNGTASNLQAWTYFTPATPLTLNLRESITVHFTFTITQPGTGGALSTGPSVRFGLTNSTTRVTADKLSGITDANWNSLKGYSAWVNANSSTTATTSALRQRTGSNDTFWAGGAHTDVASFTAVPNAVLTLVTGTPYDVTFQVTRTAASSVHLSTLIKQGANTVLTMEGSDEDDILTTFDTFGIFTGTGPARSYSLDGVTVVIAAGGVTLSGFSKAGDSAVLTWNSGGLPVTVQRSTDLEFWEDLSNADVDGSYIDLTPPSDKAFYRVKLEAGTDP